MIVTKFLRILLIISKNKYFRQLDHRKRNCQLVIISDGSGSGDGDSKTQESEDKKDKTDVVYGQEGKDTTGVNTKQSTNKYEYEYTNPEYDNGKS